MSFSDNYFIWNTAKIVLTRKYRVEKRRFIAYWDTP